MLFSVSLRYIGLKEVGLVESMLICHREMYYIVLWNKGSVMDNRFNIMQKFCLMSCAVLLVGGASNAFNVPDINPSNLNQALIKNLENQIETYQNDITKDENSLNQLGYANIPTTTYLNEHINLYSSQLTAMNELESEQNKLTTYTSEYNAAVNAIQTFNTKIADTQQEITSLQTEINANNAQTSALKSKQSALYEAYVASRNAISDADNKYVVALKNLTAENNKLDALNAKKKAIALNTTIAKTQKITLVTAINKQISTVTSAINKLNIKVKALHTAYMNTWPASKTAHQKYLTAYSNYQTALTANTKSNSANQATIKIANTNLTKYQSQVKAEDASKSTYSNEITAANNNITKYKISVSAYEAKTNISSLTSLQTKLEDAQKALPLVDAINVLKKQIASNKAQIQKLSGSHVQTE